MGADPWGVQEKLKPAERPFNRAALEELLTRRFYFRPSFEIYNGVAGLYDLGPPGCAVQANILALWRQHFVLEEQMLEVDCTIMTKDEVFKYVPAMTVCPCVRTGASYTTRPCMNVYLRALVPMYA
jgi:hypothetical protein